MQKRFCQHREDTHTKYPKKTKQKNPPPNKETKNTTNKQKPKEKPKEKLRKNSKHKAVRRTRRVLEKVVWEIQVMHVISNAQSYLKNWRIFS